MSDSERLYFWICEKCYAINPSTRVSNCKNCYTKRLETAQLMTHGDAQKAARNETVRSNVFPSPFSLKVVASRKGIGKEIVLLYGANVLGKQDSSADAQPDTHIINLGDYDDATSAISQIHAVITCRESIATITDLNSKRGTVLNQIFLEPQKAYDIHSGDKIRIAMLVMKVIKH